MHPHKLSRTGETQERVHSVIKLTSMQTNPHVWTDTGGIPCGQKVNVNSRRRSSRAGLPQRCSCPTPGASSWAESRPGLPGSALDGCQGWEEEPGVLEGGALFLLLLVNSHLLSIRDWTLCTSSRATFRMCWTSWRSAISVDQTHGEGSGWRNVPLLLKPGIGGSWGSITGTQAPTQYLYRFSSNLICLMWPIRFSIHSRVTTARKLQRASLATRWCHIAWMCECPCSGGEKSEIRGQRLSSLAATVCVYYSAHCCNITPKLLHGSLSTLTEG